MFTNATTPLHKAVLYNRPNDAYRIIKGGVDINAVCDDGCTALHLCADEEECNDLIFPKLLIEGGADPNFKDNFGRTALHIVSYKARDCGNMIQYFIDSGMDVNAQDDSGDTPLHCFLYNFLSTIPHTSLFIPDINRVLVFLENGADIFKKNDDGLTPYDMVATIDVGKFILKFYNERVHSTMLFELLLPHTM